MNNYTLCFFVGFLISTAFLTVLERAPFSDGEKWRVAVKQCEKSLPRDQHCTVVGVPAPVSK